MIQQDIKTILCLVFIERIGNIERLAYLQLNMGIHFFPGNLGTQLGFQDKPIYRKPAYQANLQHQNFYKLGSFPNTINVPSNLTIGPFLSHDKYFVYISLVGNISVIVCSLIQVDFHCFLCRRVYFGKMKPFRVKFVITKI